ncbi:MAG TPA: hypothetical protein VMG11_14540 [Steroidobacteraceae bacterium]|nr:hypothetical protein [Steroidobacteraceae bacterium]
MNKQLFVCSVLACGGGMVTSGSLAQSSNAALIAHAAQIRAAPPPESPITLSDAQFCAELDRTAKSAHLDVGPLNPPDCLAPGGSPEQRLNRVSIVHVIMECSAHISAKIADPMGELHACEDGAVAEPTS